MAMRIKRAYDKATRGDGMRILIDRLWPRGVRKDRAGIDVWIKDVAPSTELRKWFGHDPGKWEEFKHRYFKELKARRQQVDDLRKQVRGRTVTLLYGAKDEEHNNAVALREYLQRRPAKWRSD